MKNKTVILAVALSVGFLIALVYSSFGNRDFRCEVCVTYQGRSACKVAGASSRDHALRAATELACAQISSGMTDSTRCLNTPPDRVQWLSGK